MKELGVRQTIEAMAVLEREDVELLIVGRGGEWQALSAAIHLRTSSRRLPNRPALEIGWYLGHHGSHPVEARGSFVLISICVPSIRPDTLGDAIISIRGQSHTDWELVVVGQGEEGTLRAAVADAAAGDPRIRYVHLDRFGLSAARNRGISEAEGDVIAFMDDDCEAADDWLIEIATAFDRHPEVGVVAGSLVKPPAGAERFKTCPEMIPLEVLYDPVATGYESPEGFGVAGANLAVRRRVADRVGRFDELLGAGARFAAAEDTDYILRAESLGACLYSTPAAVMHHTHGYRYGLRAAYRLLRNYAVGNGALAGKLTLAGDPRGRAWMRTEVHRALVEPITSLRPQWLPRRVLRLAYYAAAYQVCRRTCQVSGTELATSVLEPTGWRER